MKEKSDCYIKEQKSQSISGFMNRKIVFFFSWQSDVRGNRNLIVNELRAECQKIKESKGYDVCIDEATRNMPGSPKIEDAVLTKISKADIFVCDITPINSNGDKLLPNPNVLFELGYAFHVLGASRIIMLARRSHWDMNNMPFDINHRRIGLFTSAKDCDLSFEISNCVDYLVQNSSRHWIVGDFFAELLKKFFSFNIRKTKKNPSIPLKATEESTVFFSRRMANAFPGERGLFEITDIKKIKLCLSKLLQYPLSFSEGLEHASSDPVWIFRGGSSEQIDSFKLLRGSKVLIGFEEFVVKRIVVFRDSARYYSEYVYVETIPDKPCGCYRYKKDEIDSFTKEFGYYDEEYALFKAKWYLPTIKISRQEYDDGASYIAGRYVNTCGKAKLRLRYLSPYNFIIAAKFSPYNSHDFCRCSENVFKGMLEGAVSDDEFEEFMKCFPKRGL